MKYILLLSFFVLISSNGYHKSMLQPVSLSKLGEDKMISWDWADFKIGENETIYLIKIEFFSFNNMLGKFQGAIGTTTIQEPDYWYITDDYTKTFNENEGSITWHVPAEIGKIIPKKSGQLKLGIWHMDLNSFYIKSLYVETIHNS